MSAQVDRKLKGMLARIFSDAVLEPNEKKELDALRATLSADVVRATLADFLATTMKHVLADGAVSDRERDKLRVIVAELKLAPADLPEDVRRAIS